MGQPAAKKDDQIVATHIHIVMMPSGAGPVPTPTPFLFMGSIDNDVSSNVNIQGKPAATVGSQASNSPQHISAPGTWGPPPPTDKASITQGSTTVFINGKPAARTGDPANACNIPGAQVLVASSTVFIG